jgi:hypothetical protein
MRNPRSWHRAILLIGCAAASLAASPGCAGLFSNRPTRPLRAPKLDVAGEVRSGTALGGPDDRVRALDGADPLVVRCRALWVERLPPALAPLDGEARLLVEPSSADPVRAVSSLAGGLGHASGLRAEAILAGAAQGEFGRSVPAWDDESPLPPGFRVAFDPGAQAAEAGIPRLAIVAARAATGAEASLVVELEPGSGEPELSLLLDTTLRPGAGPVLLAIPRAAAADEPAGLLVALEGLDEFATERGADAVSAELRAPPGTEDAAARRRAVSAAEDERREIGHALRSLDDCARTPPGARLPRGALRRAAGARRRARRRGDGPRGARARRARSAPRARRPPRDGLGDRARDLGVPRTPRGGREDRSRARGPARAPRRRGRALPGGDRGPPARLQRAPTRSARASSRRT